VWIRKSGIRALPDWVVEVREARPPPGATALHWVLYTSHSVENLAEASRVMGYYEKRWIIEEYHKALKTGCQVESRQYQTSSWLEAIPRFLAIMSVRLLQLKSVARSEPNRPATDFVPLWWVEALQTLRPEKEGSWTVGQFFREWAGLGGFLGRKGDGEPGWRPSGGDWTN
jgi:hypothetical protein